MRELVTLPGEVSAALADLQNIAREEQGGTRYVSLASAHNNVRISDTQLENLRRGVRKLLNSLSTGPQVAKFAEIGPGKTLFRVRLRDLGWDAALWDQVASHFPQAIDTGTAAALAGACQTSVPILRADWLAATATRPPLYHDILRIPKTQHELEKQFGIDSVANLQAGEAMRAGLVKSGVSLSNRMVERHPMRVRDGGYWATYDFKSSQGRGNLLVFPLGPEKARLADGQHAFQHAGEEIIFALPNGLHGYVLADPLGNRLDGAAPTDIVGDRGNVTGRVEITNGLSCIVCHDRGMKEIASPDAIRALASRFSPDEQRLIERLHPEAKKFQEILDGDRARFVSALKSADAEPMVGQPEAVGALAALFDGQVTLEVAAAELCLRPEEFRRRLDDQPQLFTIKITLRDGGSLQREHFLDEFPSLVQRLGLGTVRSAKPIAGVPPPTRAEKRRPIPVELTTDKKTYREGEDLVVTVQAAEAGHLRLLYQDAAGEIVVLFPNQYQTDDRIPAGRLVKIVPVPNPAIPGDMVAIQIAGPHFGTEYLAAIITDQPFTDEAALREELRKATFADAPASDIEGAVTKSARVISRPAQEGEAGGARTGFSRVTLTTIKK